MHPVHRFHPVPTPRYTEPMIIERRGVRYDRETTRIMFPLRIAVSQSSPPEDGNGRDKSEARPQIVDQSYLEHL